MRALHAARTSNRRCRLRAVLSRSLARRSRARLLVAGPASDVAAVRLYQAALSGTPPPTDSDASRLRRALDALQAAVDERADEAEAFAQAAARRVAAPILQGAELTEEEKLRLGRSITGGLMLGVQGSIWSSFLLLAGGIALLALLNKPPDA